MNKLELKIKDKIYTITNAILNSVVDFEIIKYYNLIKTDENSKSFNKNDYLYNGELNNMKSPKIIVMNHSNSHDFPFINNVLNKHFFILSAEENLKGFNGFVINMYGCIPVNRSDKLSRQNSSDMIKSILGYGYDVLIMVEGTWNLTPSIPILPFSWGIVDIAKESKVNILPIVLEYDYDNKKCFANIGELLDVNNFENKKDAYITIRDTLATLRWNLWELFPKVSRENLSQNSFDKLVEYMLSEYPELNYENEKKILYHDHDTYEEVMAPIKKLYRK